MVFQQRMSRITFGKTSVISLMAILLCSTAGSAQGPVFDWAVRTGAAGTSSIAESIDVDAAGNVYTAGRFTGTVDFDPGAGSVNLTSAGSEDAFITKIDPSGNLIWAKQVGGIQGDYSFANAVDGTGNVYLTGSFAGTVDFDPGPGVFNLTAPGVFIDDIFILKLDPDGNFLWAKRIGAGGLDFGQSIAVGPSGVVTTGSFEGTVDFDPGPATAFLVAPAGQDEIFILKLSPNGDLVWAKRMGGSSGDFGRSITLDASESVYSTGFFRGTADFDPGPATFNLTDAGNSDVFVSKLDASGNFVWASRMGGTDSEAGYGIKVDIAGNVYTTGDFHGTADFDPGAGTSNLVSAGFNDSFISKLDASGNFIWAKRIGGDNDDQGTSLSLDGAGNVYTAGSFESSTIDLDPGPGTFNVTPVGSGDVFITKLDPSGNYVWAVTFGGPSYDLLNSIHVNVVGRITTTGYFSNTVDFDPGAGTSNLTAVGTRDIFVTRLSQAPVPPTITSFAPASGPVGSSLTINGTNFSTEPGYNIVYFGATQAIVTAATANQLTVTVPTGATYQPISVTVAGATGFSSSPFLVTFPDGGVIDACAFSTPTFYSSGNFGYGLALGDLDGDGKTDIATTNSGTDAVRVFRNTSTTGTLDANSFAPAVDFPVGTDPFAVALADVDGDGKLDILATSNLSNIVSIFRNISVPGNLTVGSFEARVDFTTASGPERLACQDLDLDGRNDIVVANNSNSLSIFRNVGMPGTINSTSFSAPFTIAAQANAFAVSDIDVDGRPDLIVGHSIGNQLGVIRNISTPGSLSAGSFAARVDFLSGAWLDHMTIGDLDSDGRPDIVTSSWPGGSFSIHKNTSTPGTIDAGSFAPIVTFTGHTEPRGVTITDFDGDGKADLAVANQISGSASIYKNIGTPGTITTASFSPRVDFPAGGNSRHILAGDFDGDGKPDLAMTNWSGPPMSVIRNTVSGLPPPTITGFAPPSGLAGTAVTINGTNFSTTPLNNTVRFNGVIATITSATPTSLDVVVPLGAIIGPVTVQVGCNVASSPAEFIIPPPTITSFAPINGPPGTTVIITGTNFDPVPANNIVYFGATRTLVTTGTTTELTVTSPQGATYQPVSVTTRGYTAHADRPYVSTFTGDGVINATTFALKVDFATAARPSEVIFGDLDGDGKTDLATINDSSPTVSVLRNTSTTGTISFAAKVDLAAGGSSQGMEVGDIDADGKLDLVTVSDGASQVSVFRNVSTSGTISFSPRVNFATGTTPVSVAIGDLDRDGRIDLAVVNASSNSVSIYRNIGSQGNIAFTPRVNFTTGSTPYDVNIVDIDGDSAPDVVVSSRGASIVSIFRNISTPGALALQPRVDFSTSAGTQPYGFAVGDLDGDDKPDIATANNLSNTVSILRNVSTPGAITTGSFDAAVSLPNGVDPSYMSFGDVNGDSKPDLIVSNNSGTTIQVYKNLTTTGPFSVTSFDAAVSYTTGTRPYTAKSGDLDGDGIPELAIANATSNTVSVLRNNTITSCVPTPQRDALIALYNATDGANWDDNTGWLSTDVSTWFGVTVSGCNVIDIALPGNNLIGALPPEIGDLTLLEGLDLGANQLNGWIPPEIGNLSSLIALNLSLNQMDGPIPVEIGSLTNLQVLGLAFNLFNGNLPLEMENLSSLTDAFLNNNQFSGTAPLIGGNSMSMSNLELQFNSLTNLPDFNGYYSINSINVASNRLTFDDLEPYVGLSNFFYDPQALVPPGGIISFIPGGTLNIPFSTGGTANSYQWYKDNVAIPGATSSSLSIPGATAADVGFYKVRITSAIVPILILESFPYTVITDPCASSTPTSGELDTSFAPLIDVPSNYSQPAQQTSGKILVGTDYTSIGSIITSGILRFNTDGSLDNTFASNSYGPYFIRLPDDRILAATNGNLELLDADGNPDASFNNPSYYNATIYALALQSDGKILVSVNEDGNLHLDRLNANGTLDASFSAPLGIEVTSIRVQTDDHIVIGGYFVDGIMRLDPTGAIDPTFNATASDFVTDVAIQSDGKILVVGYFNYMNDIPRRNVARLESDGTLDPTFVALGITDPFESGFYFTRIALQPDNKIILAGVFGTINGADRKNLVRLNPDGTVDCPFDPGLSTDNVIEGLALQSDNKILISGSFTDYDGTQRFGFARVNNITGSTITITLQPSDAIVCEGATATFSTAATGASNITYQWQYSSDGVAPFNDISNGGGYADVTTATLSVNTTGAFGSGRYRCKINGDLAPTVYTNDEGLFINSLPAAPTTTGAFSCSSGTLTLTASGAVNGQYRWYTLATGGTAITGEVNSTYVTPILTATTTYFVAINNGTCESATRTSVDATINTPPTAPTTSGAANCSAASLTLTASGGINGQYRWYTAATGGTALVGEVNDTYTTPVLTTTTTYHVAIDDGTCESVRTPVTASINTVAKPILVTSNCTATGALLAGPTGFTSYAWSSGETTQQITVTTAGSYTLVVTASTGCVSPASDPTVFTPTFCNQAPTIAPTSVTTTVEGTVTIDVTTLTNDLDNNIDLSTLQVLVAPASGANAFFNSNAELIVDYSGIAFAGTDQLTIQVCDVAGACGQEIITIEVAGEITVYNALSPNGDGKNDALFIQYIDALPDTKSNKLTIFNRWGSVVFEATDYDNTNNVFKGIGNGGNELPTGTYYYTLEFTSGLPKRTGFISLRR